MDEIVLDTGTTVEITFIVLWLTTVTGMVTRSVSSGVMAGVGFVAWSSEGSVLDGWISAKFGVFGIRAIVLLVITSPLEGS